jgi:hypothetical protein
MNKSPGCLTIIAVFILLVVVFSGAEGLKGAGIVITIVFVVLGILVLARKFK